MSGRGVGCARVPAGVEVRLTAHDSRGRAFFNRTAKLSDAGAVSEDIKLPVGVLGTFRVELAYKDAKDGWDAAAAHEFEVQEYRPNAFEISIGGPRSALGETALSLPVTAKYYMGKSLSSAHLNWSIEAGDEGFAPVPSEGRATSSRVTSTSSRALNRRLIDPQMPR